jgi:putative oxidoreductase
MSVAWALLIIRLVVGLTLAAHGAQKLFGWFGGPGFVKVEHGFRAQGLKPARLWTALAILGEVGGGLSLAFGFLTALGAAGAIGAMVMAIRTHWTKGFFGSRGGYEYPLVLLAMGLALGLAGPGAYSLDTLFRIAWPQALVFGIFALAAVLMDVIGILMTRSATPSVSTASSRGSELPAHGGRAG